jgi:hypothetical protein
VRIMSTLVLAAGLAAPALSQTVPVHPEACMHVQTQFEFQLHAPYSTVAPLFGPDGERVWAGKDWDPQFIHPQPAADVEGAVFTVRHGSHNATWVNTLFDVDGRHFQYVYFLPEIMVTVIDVRFTIISADVTRVNVVYTRTAITPEANPHVTAMSEHDKSACKEWQQSIDDYLAHKKLVTVR